MTDHVYQPHCVLFMDILGFRSLIKEGKEALVLSVLQGLEEKTTRHDMAVEDVFKMTAFSDSIVFSKDFKHNWYDSIMGVLQFASYFQLAFLNEGIMTRGGIAIGDLRHRGNIVFGPALNEAYELESRIASYPRIVLSSAAIKEFKEGLQVREGATQLVDGTLIRRDFDGVHHVHIFGEFAPSPADRLTGVKADDFSFIINWERRYADAVDNLLKERDKIGHDPRIRSKYDWLENYHQESLKAERKL